MSTLTAPLVEIEPGAEAYAESKGVGDVFRHVVASVPRLFPTFRSLKAFIRPDPEIRDYTFIIIEVRVSRADVPDRKEAEWRWFRDFDDAYPIPREQSFVLRLLREPA